jgi:hypothetical protein
LNAEWQRQADQSGDDGKDENAHDIAALIAYQPGKSLERAQWRDRKRFSH